MPLGINRLVAGITPPVLLRLRPQPLMPAYSTFDQAVADSDTYEDPSVIELVSEKTGRLRKALGKQGKVVSDRQTVQNMFVLALVHRERPIDVLEIGGACGAVFMTLNHLLPGKINRWCVVETPAMAEVGNRLFRDNRLSFFGDLSAAAQQVARRDLFVAQGVLQYTRDPLGTWKDLLALGFEFAYVSRTVVGMDITSPIITKQVVNLADHGPGPTLPTFRNRKTSQPLTIIPFESLARIPSDYRLICSFLESEDQVMRIRSRQVTTRTIGFLLQKVSG